MSVHWLPALQSEGAAFTDCMLQGVRLAQLYPVACTGCRIQAPPMTSQGSCTCCFRIQCLNRVAVECLCVRAAVATGSAVAAAAAGDDSRQRCRNPESHMQCAAGRAPAPAVCRGSSTVTEGSSSSNFSVNNSNTYIAMRRVHDRQQVLLRTAHELDYMAYLSKKACMPLLAITVLP